MLAQAGRLAITIGEKCEATLIGDAQNSVLHLYQEHVHINSERQCPFLAAGITVGTAYCLHACSCGA